jgi:hypothetical protein
VIERSPVSFKYEIARVRAEFARVEPEVGQLGPLIKITLRDGRMTVGRKRSGKKSKA